MTFELWIAVLTSILGSTLPHVLTALFQHGGRRGDKPASGDDAPTAR